ncbi:hypothetical protein R3P38DRAFT_2769014 [Favolaschia claudopus]|uniref:Uncharacterized protein n=1 Tax=Favolaschia claudopus TaxID=2862362 RepID=A0AAW0CQ24_9AGAR
MPVRWRARSARSLKTSLEFISAVKDASLDNGDLDSDSLARLRDPPTHPIEINNADLRFTLDIFLAATRASEEVFNVVRQASLRRHPDDKVFTLPSIKKKVAKWTGVVPILSHMCPNTCMAYTGPFANKSVNQLQEVRGRTIFLQGTTRHAKGGCRRITIKEHGPRRDDNTEAN